ncbi:hypothetical protein K1W54_40905 [Micromonospora sp. CPCC 205371]|nr:hypothetical protein [Micromonospora sp. CPCC 205371]
MAGEQPVRVLLITIDNTAVHVYDSVAELLADQSFAARPPRAAIECFDSAGYRLAPRYGAGWRIAGMDRTHDRPDPDAVRRRVTEAVKYMADRIVKSAEQLKRFGLTPEEALAMLPNPDDVDLAEVGAGKYDMLDPHPDNLGSALHNFLVHGII